MIYILLSAILASGILASNATAGEYDYVIIGSGPGGGPLAANLALSGASVFLMEAGGNHSAETPQAMPARSGYAAENAPHSWQYFVEHFASNETQARRDSKYTYRLSNGSYHVGFNPPADATPLGLMYPRGATLGGSAQVNAMNLAWAPDNEWDHIAELTGDASWGHANMRRHFMDMENCTYVPRGTPGHGFDGFLQSTQGNLDAEMQFPNTASFFAQVFHQVEGITINSTAEMSRLLRRDINGIESDRYHEMLFGRMNAINPTTGTRSGAAGYISSVVAAGHPLTVSLNSLASKLIFEDVKGTPKAVGVEYLYGENLYSAGQLYNASQTAEVRTVRAKKEVIVSAGAFNTPQILKLSGLGPREELEEHGIPVVIDMPAVGNFLQDNYEAPVIIRATQDWMNFSSPCTGTYDASDPCFVLWQTNGTGPYATQGGLYFTSRSSQSWDDDADLFHLSGAGRERIGFFPGYSSTPIAPRAWVTSMVKMQTNNPSGTVKLRSRDPRIAPAIDLNYFARNADVDLQALREGAELLLRAFDGTGVPYEVLTPDPNAPMEQGLMDESFSHHATSSCRMGPANATGAEACVDSRFRVKGVESLRIVDASVWPRVPGAFPNGPTFTMSMKASEVILKGE